MGFAKARTNREKQEARLSREQLINDHLPYVKRIVHRIGAHLPSTVEMEDLINAGVIGLIEAVDRYDPSRDNKFMTYAAFRINGAVLSELRSRDFLSRSTRKKLRELENAYARLEQKLGREVEDEEVSRELGMDLDSFYRIKNMSGISFISYEEAGCSTTNEKENLVSYLVKGRSDDALTMARIKEIKAGVARAISQLGEKEKLVISLYYWDELTMKEIGKVLDITESRISQIHSEAILHLRTKLRRENLLES